MDEVFKKNKNLDVYFKTSDGKAFFTENAAKNHQRELDKKSKKKGKVTKVTKEAQKASKTENTQNAQTAEKGKENKDADNTKS